MPCMARCRARLPVIPPLRKRKSIYCWAKIGVLEGSQPAAAAFLALRSQQRSSATIPAVRVDEMMGLTS
eukprot:1079770-Pleurochrysis_carterae.AAC.1